MGWISFKLGPYHKTDYDNSWNCEGILYGGVANFKTFLLGGIT